MCGIAGILRIHQPSDGPPPPHHDAIPEAWLDILDNGIKHRGPDGAGRFRDRTTRPDGTVVDVALVHRRLSIIDHAGGHQPMVHLRRPDGSGELLLPPGLSGGTGVPPVSSSSSRDDDSQDMTGGTPVPPKADSITLDATPLPQGTDLIAVAFNGCIYNHRELRQELEALGHRFCTDHSDTEVLIHGWRAWGLGMQDKLDGMYALTIWDRGTGQLATATDLAGEKPIYRSHAIDGQSLTWSSSNASLDQFERVYNALRTQNAGWCFLTAVKYGLPTLATWICNGVSRDTAPILAPATWATHPGTPNRGAMPCSGTSGFALRRSTNGDRQPAGWMNSVAANRWVYSDLPHTAGSKSVDRSPEYVLARSLTHSITSRLEADVPLGVFLSGGLDSALIAAIAKQHRPDLKTFTVRMPVDAYDESADAAATAAHLGTDHHTLDCEPRPAEDLVHLIEQLGLPFGDSSLLPTSWVCKAAREHVKVALSGDGGDELFGGYRRHTIAPALNRWRHLLRLIPDRLLDQRTPGSRQTYLARLATAARHGGYEELLAIFPTPDLRRLLEINDNTIGHERFYKVTDPLRHDFERYLPDDLLRKTDTASMAVALEVRAPFLARELVDAAMRTPLNVLMPRGERKGLLKRIARQHLPEHIINRPKRGFAVPISDWFRTDYGGMRQLLHDHLRSAEPFPGLADANVRINMNFVEQMLREHDAAGERSLNPWHGRDHGQRLYMLLVLSIWSRWLARLRPARAAGAPEAEIARSI